MNFYEAFTKKDLKLTLRAFKFTPLFPPYINPDETGLFEGSFFWGGINLTSPLTVIFQEKLI